LEEELQVSAAVLTHEGGRILLARRAPGRTHGGLWEFPGGKVESGETPEASLIRELREELDLEVEVVEPLAQVAGHLPSGRPLRLLAFRVRAQGPGPDWVRNGLDLGPEEARQRGLPDHDAITWAEPGLLDRYPMPPVDRDLTRRLRPPRTSAEPVQEAGA
jgi:8-oxo-dGTP diphosphatase